MPIEWLLYPALGVLAGLLAGLLGSAADWCWSAALALLLPTQGVPAESAMHAALATSLASVVVTVAGLGPRARASRRGDVAAASRWLVPGLLVGAWLGSLVRHAPGGRQPALVRGRLLRAGRAAAVLRTSAQPARPAVAAHAARAVAGGHR